MGWEVYKKIGMEGRGFVPLAKQNEDDNPTLVVYRVKDF
jgi:hypothetical protein